MIDLRDKRPDICIRLRLLGEMWLPHFMRIALVTETGVILKSEISDTLVRVPHLSHIMQFEIDRQFQNFKPHFHYRLRTSG